MIGRWLLCWVGLAIVAVALVGAFTPLGYVSYVWAFPNETTAYTNELKGGPYPELTFLFVVLPAGLLVTGLGLLWAWGVGPRLRTA